MRGGLRRLYDGGVFTGGRRDEVECIAIDALIRYGRFRSERSFPPLMGTA